MGENRIFDTTIDIAAKALDLRSRRHEMIISNIANADTPGYKAFDLMVEEAMQTNGSQPKRPGVLLRTHPNHIPQKISSQDDLSAHIIQPEAMENLRGDGNTVDMDREMSNLAVNQIFYKATAQIVSKKFEEIMYAIQGGNR